MRRMSKVIFWQYRLERHVHESLWFAYNLGSELAKITFDLLESLLACDLDGHVEPWHTGTAQVGPQAHDYNSRRTCTPQIMVMCSPGRED